jgi:hypothetical protein
MTCSRRGGNSWCYLICAILSTMCVLPGIHEAAPESFHSLTYRHDLDILHTLLISVDLVYEIPRLLAAIVLEWRSMPST